MQYRLFRRISVLFFGLSSVEQFRGTQARLSADYGTMPTPSPTEKDKLRSQRIIKRFAIEHVLRGEESQNLLELVMFYRTKGDAQDEAEEVTDAICSAIVTCEKCAQKLRVPARKGQLQLRCPSCGHTFLYQISY